MPWRAALDEGAARAFVEDLMGMPSKIRMRREAAMISREAMGIPHPVPDPEPVPTPPRRRVTLRLDFPLPDAVLNAWAREP